MSARTHYLAVAIAALGGVLARVVLGPRLNARKHHHQVAKSSMPVEVRDAQLMRDIRAGNPCNQQPVHHAHGQIRRHRHHP